MIQVGALFFDQAVPPGLTSGNKGGGGLVSQSER